MTVNSRPVSSRIQFSYPNDMSIQRFNGVHPHATVGMIFGLVQQLNILQTANATEGYITVESELEEA